MTFCADPDATNSLAPCLREPEAAILVGLAPNTLAKLRVKGGGPPYLKLGRSVRYPQVELIAWMNKRMRTSTSNKQRVAV